MTTITASHGSDTHTRDDHANRNYAGGNLVRAQSTHRYIFLHIPVTDIRGRTVLSATLTGHAAGTFSAQTITVAAVSASWAAGKTTWNNQPGVGTSVATAVSSTADGAAVNLDVTAILQSVANGSKWRGFRIATAGTTADRCNFYSFDSPNASWTLTVQLSDTPEQPSDLRPSGSLAVGSSRPILAWSYTDLGGDSSDQGAFRVQVDPAANGTTPAFDTGWVTSSDPQYDLSSGSFTALTAGASTQWRVATKDAAGNQSLWSDWAQFSYVAYPTLTIDSPTGTIGDATPTVQFHMTGETLTQWRVEVLDAAGNVRWDSGLSDGTGAVTVPLRDSDGRWGWGSYRYGTKVLDVDNASYTFQVRAWGNVARADAVGLPAYVQATSTVTFSESVGVTTPDTFAVAAAATGDPRITFTWHRTSSPDAFQILDGNKIYAQVESGDWTVVSGNYSWTDQGLADPFVQHSFTIRAVDTGVRSQASSVVLYTPKIVGVWLVPADGSLPIQLDGRTSLDQFAENDRRASYKPINSSVNVDIVYGFEGASGHFDGILSDRQDQTAAVTRLEAVRKDVASTPRLVWGKSIPVQVSNLKVLPGADYTPAQPVYNVSFDFIQAGD